MRFLIPCLMFTGVSVLFADSAAENRQGLSEAGPGVSPPGASLTQKQHFGKKLFFDKNLSTHAVIPAKAGIQEHNGYYGFPLSRE